MCPYTTAARDRADSATADQADGKYRSSIYLEGRKMDECSSIVESAPFSCCGARAMIECVPGARSHHHRR